MFPIVPLLCLGGMLGGAFGLRWYSQLSKVEKEQADRYAAAKANELFGSPLDRLTAAQAERVNELTKHHFAA
jgi:hypothetical protein